MESQSTGRFPNVGFENATPFRIARKPVRGSGYQALVESATKAPPPVTHVEEMDYRSRGLGTESTVETRGQREQSGLENLATEGGHHQKLEVKYEAFASNIESWAQPSRTQEHVSAEDFYLYNRINTGNEASNLPRTQETAALPEPSGFSTDFGLSDLPSTFEDIFGHLIEKIMRDRENLQNRAIKRFPPYKDFARLSDGTSEVRNLRTINENYTYTTSMESGLNDIMNGRFERAKQHLGRALNIGSDREIAPQSWTDAASIEMMDTSSYAILLARTETLLFLGYASMKLHKFVETAVFLDFAIYHCPARGCKEVLVILRGLLFYGEDYIGQALPTKREHLSVPRIIRTNYPAVDNPPVGGMVAIKGTARVNRLGHIPNGLVIQNNLLAFATSSGRDYSPTKQLSNIMLLQFAMIWSRSRLFYRPYKGRPWFYRKRSIRNGIGVDEERIIVQKNSGEFQVLSKEVYLGMFESHFESLYDSLPANHIQVGDFVSQKPRKRRLSGPKSGFARWLLSYDEVNSQALPQQHRFLWSPPDDADLLFGHYTATDPHKLGPLMSEVMIGDRGPAGKWPVRDIPETTVYDLLISYIQMGSPQKQEQVILKEEREKPFWNENIINTGDVIRVRSRMGFAGAQWQHHVISKHPSLPAHGHFDARELAYLPYETIGNLASFFEAEMRLDWAKQRKAREDLLIDTIIDTEIPGADDQITIPLLPTIFKNNRGIDLYMCRCKGGAPKWSEPKILDEKRHLENTKRNQNGFINDYSILCLGEAGASSEKRQQRASRGGPWDGCGKPRMRAILDAPWKNCDLRLVMHLVSDNLHAVFGLLHDGHNPDEHADLAFLSTLSSPVPSLKTLLWLGADIAAVNKAGETALHLAVLRWYDEERVVEFLLNHNAPLDSRTLKGYTPLGYVALRRSIVNGLKSNYEDKTFLRGKELGPYFWPPDMINKQKHSSRTNQLEKLLSERMAGRQ